MIAAAAPHWIWTVPFVAMLLCIAILPLLRATERWWHSNRNKLLVSLGLAAVTLAYYGLRGEGFGHGESASSPGWPTVRYVFEHSVLHEYVPFLTLLFSLYVISGGILVSGDLRATPLVNTGILALGGGLASFIGTTGASMVLIRLLLKTNSERQRVVHTVVFFIFIVSNIGGSLLPIGDPPLFLGFLRGVPFLWTLGLWQEWAVCMGALLLIYFAWDSWEYRRESQQSLTRDRAQRQPLRVAGLWNVVWLVGVVLAVAVIIPGKPIPGTNIIVNELMRELTMFAITALAWITTPATIRKENEFNLIAIAEVAALFIGIFVTMQTPIEILHAAGPALAKANFTEPWKFFWATGVLSSFLDNAPTYVVFFETANQLTHAPGPGIIKLVTGEFIREDQLVAISCGAVFMGANTYIGNGPNFMVKSIAEQAGVKMPSFLGYMLYSGAILIPLFIAMSFFVLP